MMQCVTAASGFVASYQFLVKHQRYLTCCTLALPKAVTRRPCLPAQNSLHQLIANKMCELQQFFKEDHVLNVIAERISTNTSLAKWLSEAGKL